MVFCFASEGTCGIISKVSKGSGKRMSEISLHTAEEKAGVYVSNTFIDTYMKDANGEYVKIYLYLLRALGGSGKDFSIAAMADALEHTAKDITRALHYWERAGLLRLEYSAAGELTGICLLDPDKPRLMIHEEAAAAAHQITSSPYVVSRQAEPQQTLEHIVSQTQQSLTQIGSKQASVQVGTQQAQLQLGSQFQPALTQNGSQQSLTQLGTQQMPLPFGSQSGQMLTQVDVQQAQLQSASQQIMPQTQEPSTQIASSLQQTAGNVVRMPQRQGFAQSPDHSYSPDEITLLGKDDCVREILFVTESYMGHPLSPNETNTVLYWYDGMGMSSDLIEYLVEYCIERGHKNIRYMNRVAIGWDEEGISTKDDAVRRIRTHNSLYKTVRKAFGIMGRELTSPEEKYIDSWQQSYGFTIEVIEEACERTIMKAHSPSFAYADSILRNWYESGVKQLKDVTALDEAYTKKEKPKRTKTNVVQNDRFHNFQEQQYDYDAIERQLLMQE